MRLTRRQFQLGALASGGALAALPAKAASGLTIGVVLPLSGIYANEGSQYENGIKLYQTMHGTTAAGLPVKLVMRDDQGPASGDLSRRMAQELIVREKADVILGFSFTPNAMATASLLTEAQKPGIIINAATSILTEKSPNFVRVSFTTAQTAYVLGEYAAKQGDQDRLHHRVRLWAGHRCGDVVYQGLYQGRRQDRRERPYAGVGDGIRAVSAAGDRGEAGRRVQLRSGRGCRRGLHEGSEEARADGVRGSSCW